MDLRPIALLDSGIGGLSVASAVRRRLPRENLIYLGDTARVPYGSRSQKLIEVFSVQGVRFLLQKNPKILVVACNTMTALALRKIKKYVQGQLGVIDVIQPTVQQVQKIHQKGVVAVIGTRATISSGIYLKKLSPLPVVQKACPLLVPLVEEGFIRGPITHQVVSYYLEEWLDKSEITELILGCTHYPLIKETIQQRIGPQVRVIDSAEPTAQFLARYLKEHRLESSKKSEDRFYFTDISPNLKNQVQLFGGRMTTSLYQVRL